MGNYITTIKESIVAFGDPSSGGNKADEDVLEAVKFDKISLFKIEKTLKFRDNYMIGQSMGSSHYGEVRKCKNIRSNVIRAVKIYQKEKLNKFEFERLTNEIEILKRLDHPNIIKLYEFYEDDNRYYLVTELCTGGEVIDVLANKEKVTEKEASIIIAQMLSAIAYCHRQNVIHRDLKCDNIMFDVNNKIDIKLTDFSASTVFM